jgi:CHAT domain-containing protein
LEDKGEALRALIALYLREGRVGSAFETLERAKSQLLLSYLTNKEHLHWVKDDVRSRHLVEELDRLRAEHQWYYRLAYDPPRNAEYPSAVSTEQALLELSDRERRMRAVTEQLYLRNKDGQSVNPAPTHSFHTIQQTLDENTLLVEFYNDGTDLWAFTLDQKTIGACRLPLSVDTFHLLLRQLQNNIATALRFNPQSDNSQRLTSSAQRILHRLYSLLIEPLALAGRDIRQLVIVPYGGLHYLPFHLLHDGAVYLFERYETVILPSASLLARPRVKRKPGALILAHSWNGRLDHTFAESQIVQQLFDGVLHTDDMARRTDLQAAPVQILHIAAHGQHRLDQPDLSYLQLADGQLYADDLLQQDLSYELVTLSACETGKANVSAGDELIGLGRGFLYAGAGALLASLWQVADVSTMQFMERMYMALRAGVSKSAALREAQIWLLRQDPQIHPAFWGAFQLIGDDSPLSDINHM